MRTINPPPQTALKMDIAVRNNCFVTLRTDQRHTRGYVRVVKITKLWVRRQDSGPVPMPQGPSTPDTVLQAIKTAVVFPRPEAPELSSIRNSV